MKILDGNAFKLRITCEQNIESYRATMDMGQVDSLLVNFVRRGRSPQEASVDDPGRVVVENGGDLAIGVYGVELTGYYKGAPWRFYAADVFEITDDENEVSEAVIDEGVPIYDVTFTLSLGGSADISFVDSAIINHDNSNSAHPELRQELSTKVDDILVDDESVVVTDPLTGKKEVKFDSDNFGKVDDVKVNGNSVVSQKVANIPVPTKTSELQNDSDFVNENDMQSALDEKQDKIDTVNLDYQEDGGSPSASASFENGELDISMKNMKMKFSELTAEEKESLRGPQGIPGEGAIWTGQGEEIMTLAQTTGQAINKGMSQKAITESFPQMAYDDNADLDLVDQYGNVLMRLENGGVKTKEFNSEKIKYVEVGNKDFTDLDFEDENGNVVLRVEDGYVKTKHFDSSRIKPQSLPELCLPTHIYSYVGDIIQMFKYPILQEYNYRDYGVSLWIDSPNASVRKQAKTLGRYFEFIPTSTGRYTIKAAVTDNNLNILTEQNIIVDVITPTSPLRKKISC